MRPSTAELLAGVIDELRGDVLRMVDDPWVASRLRSIVALLTHLSVRVEHEDAVLRASNVGLGTALAACAALIPTVVPPDADDHDEVEARNLDLRARFEVLLRELRVDASAPAAEARRILVAALQDDAEREAVLYAPFLRMATY